MKNKLLFIAFIVLCAGIIASMFGFYNVDFFVTGVGGFLVGSSIMAFYILRKA